MVSFEETVIVYLERLWKIKSIRVKSGEQMVGTQRRQKLVCLCASSLQVKTQSEPEGINW